MQFELTKTEKNIFKHIDGILGICNNCEYRPETHREHLSDEEYNDMIKEDAIKALDTLAIKIGRRALSQEFKMEL